MRFVALISGGKDSFYAALECVKHGHELVALANLHPVQNEGTVPSRSPLLHAFLLVDEVDSFMFQSVGHQVIPSYAECLGVPLFRASMSGHASVTSLHYSSPLKQDTSPHMDAHAPSTASVPLDDVEALYNLLWHVKVS